MLSDLYKEMLDCQACKLRGACLRVVPATGQMEDPLLMIVGEAPGQDEDEQGVPFVGKAGQILRRALRETGILNKSNTIITNTVKCRPPKNNFPKDDSASICTTKWLSKEIEQAAPKRMLLLGNVPLKYVASMSGITKMRGQWLNIRGIRTMATYHPSYVSRCDGDGRLDIRRDFERDIQDVADEIGELQNAIHQAGRQEEV